MIDAAHDLSDGGLIQAVVESCLRGGKGARLVVPGRPGRRSPSCSRESAGRAVVAVPRSEELRFNDMCGARGLPVTRIGVVDGDEVEVQGEFSIPLSELRTAHEATIPACWPDASPIDLSPCPGPPGRGLSRGPARRAIRRVEFRDPSARYRRSGAFTAAEPDVPA